MSEQKLGLKETKEVHAFFIGFLADFKKHKSDDGKVDTAEWFQMATANAPAGVRAVMGIDRVDDEIKDRDAGETEELAKMGVQLMQALAEVLL